jgi:hypothetical protein
VFPLSLGVELLQPPFEINCETWNDSTLYDHALTVILHIDPALDKDIDIKTLIKRFWYDQ